ncbi:MAG: GDP-mannose 4,6-dehydratase [Thermoplasmata archaeon]
MEKGEELIIFDNLKRFGSEINLNWLKKYGNFIYVHGDIRNYNDVEEAIKKFKPEVIFHTAAQVAMTTSIENPILDFETNTIGTLNILESVRKFLRDTIIIYSSTNKVYGDLNKYQYKETPTRYICQDYPIGFDENIPLDLKTPYGISKGTADNYALEYFRIFGLKTVVFRFSSIYGERQFATVDQGWVGWFVSEALRRKNKIINEPITINGNGKQVRDILYIDDVVSLYFKAISKIDEINGEAFNIGGGINNSLSIIELFNFLKKEFKVDFDIKKLQPRLSDQKFFVANINKIKNKLGWEPKISKIEGIKKMIDWIGSKRGKAIVTDIDN